MASSTRSALWAGVLAVGFIGTGFSCQPAQAAGGGAQAPPAESGAQAQPSDTGERVSAHWVQRKTHFVYQGFTTHYSCEGLRDNLRDILRQLGARADMKLNRVGCVRALGRPEPFPTVDAVFYVLAPADDGHGAGGNGGGTSAAGAAGARGAAGGEGASSAPVEAQWQSVRLQIGNTPLDEAGMCELLEQVNHHILPLFSPRKVDFRSSCIPHQLTVGGTTLTAEVLKPVPSGPGSSPKA